jgi:protein required for attachment to host cells
MSDYCVVVVDSSRARFFTLEAASVPELESGPNLVECSDLVNPEASLSGRETWTEARSGRNTARGGGPAHSYDDHRNSHDDEVNRRFAKRIAEETESLARRNGVKYLVLVAANRMLGFLRETLTLPSGKQIEVREVAKDLARLHPQEIHRNLNNYGALPARGNKAAAF